MRASAARTSHRSAPSATCALELKLQSRLRRLEHFTGRQHDPDVLWRFRLKSDTGAWNTSQVSGMSWVFCEAFRPCSGRLISCQMLSPTPLPSFRANGPSSGTRHSPCWRRHRRLIRWHMFSPTTLPSVRVRRLHGYKGAHCTAAAYAYFGISLQSLACLLMRRGPIRRHRRRQQEQPSGTPSAHGYCTPASSLSTGGGNCSWSALARLVPTW